MNKNEQIEELENDFETKDKSLHINFWLNNKHEREMLDELSKDTGLTNSAYIRRSIIVNYKRLKHGTQDV